MRSIALLTCASALLALAAAATPDADYVVALLHRGETRAPLDAAAIDSLQASHMANISRMAASGLLLAAGPMGDTGPLRGLFFFRPESLATLRQEMAPDGAIAAGRLVPTLIHWRGPAALGARYRERLARGETGADSMAVYTLVLLHRTGHFSGDLPGDPARWRRHRADLAARGPGGGLRMAGPFLGDRDYVGMLVFEADSLAASRWMAREPFVRDGRVRAEYRPWWTAVAVLP